MIAISDLRKLARARLADAEALYQAGRLDGSAYMCGYVVELALKARICRTLKWLAYPQTRGEFEGLQSFKTHDLDMLLRMSGRERVIKAKYIIEWSAVEKWDPEMRYARVGTVALSVLQNMLAGARILLGKL